MQPSAAHYHGDLGEYLLPYEAIRTSATPEADLLAFFQSTYEAGANAAGWNRTELERQE